jgi:hypothetical protein
LHGPLTALKRESGGGGDELCAATRRLFDLAENDRPGATAAEDHAASEPEEKVS